MQGAIPVVRPRPPRLPWRTRVGLGLSVVTLVMVVFPGQMLLPSAALTPFMPVPHGCFNFLAPLVFLFFLVVSIGLSFVIISLGITGVVLTAVRKPAGIVIATVVNAIVASLLLLFPVSINGPAPTSGDPGFFGLFVLLAVCALFPIAAIVLLLLPSHLSRRALLATLLAVVLLLAPGAVGSADYGLHAAGVFGAQPASTQVATTQRAPC